MSTSIIARRYAQALFELASTLGEVDRVERELKSVADLWEKNRDFRTIINHQKMPAKAKKDVLRAIFGPAFSKTTMNFLLLVTDKRREPLLPQFYQQFRVLVEASRNMVEGEVKSAVPLGDRELRLLEERFSELTGKVVSLRPAVDASLIGGVVVRIGDRVYDGSVAARLASLRARLKELEFRETEVTSS